MGSRRSDIELDQLSWDTFVGEEGDEIGGGDADVDSDDDEYIIPPWLFG